MPDDEAQPSAAEASRTPRFAQARLVEAGGGLFATFEHSAFSIHVASQAHLASMLI